MFEKIISGIQQIGIGVENIKEAWKWHFSAFGMDIRAFDDDNIADVMAPYMGGKPREKRAILALNLQGGGGFEFWQHTGRKPQKPKFKVQIGDLGIFAAKIKCKDIQKTHQFYQSTGIKTLNGLMKDPAGNLTFYLKDPYGNYFQLKENNSWYKEEKKHTGGTFGAIIGVTDIDKARKVYSDILDYDNLIYDKVGVFEDLKDIPGGSHKMRRVLLTHSKPRFGSFSKVFGPSEIELIQVTERKPKKIFEGRFWGDLGFIHLCYDIIGMQHLKKECKEKGFEFKIDSFSKHNNGSFDMGDAAGHFSYIEDPDGTLIEFVETHKVPIIKKLGWYMNLKKRKPGKNLPDWMIKALKFNRVKWKYFRS